MTYYMGIDVGSTTCKVVIVDGDGNKSKQYITRINAEPLDSLIELIKANDIEKYIFNGIGVTGSARNIIGKCIHADIIKSEIIAHTFAAISTHGNVASIIEIGGQDSKCIRLTDNIINEFKINSVCAAGTGSFLQWQAERLGLSIEEFDTSAMESTELLKINGKCAVFIESAIINYQRMGEKKANIANAICFALAKNYINELCNGEELIEPIVFQGGVAKLKSMQRAFSTILNKSISVSYDSEFMGAYGMALIAKSSSINRFDKNLKFNDVISNKYKKEIVICSDCQRKCELVSYSDENSQGFLVGGRCGKY